MRLRDVPHKVAFRQLVDLEDGESEADLPVMRRPIIDKLAVQASPLKAGHRLVVYADGIISSLPADTDVEVV